MAVNRPAAVRHGNMTMETPSQGIVNAASNLKYGVDKRGRKIGVVKPNALQRFRLFKLLGADGASNNQLVGAGMVAMIVKEIDGEIITSPNTERQLEALIGRLDDDGIMCVNDILIKDMGFGQDDEEDEGEDDEVEA